jgi:hypothetical protein
MRKNGRNGVDDVVTRLLTGQFGVESQKRRAFTLLQNIQTDFGAHQVSSMDNEGSFLGDKLAGE